MFICYTKIKSQKTEINMFTKRNLCSLWSNVVLGTTLCNFIP